MAKKSMFIVHVDRLVFQLSIEYVTDGNLNYKIIQC